MKVIDIHAHFGLWLSERESPDRLKIESILQKAGIEKCCVSSMRAIRYGVREGNREVLENCAKSESLLGYVVVNPNFPSTLDELKLLDESSFVGVKLHPDWHKYPINSVRLKSYLKKMSRSKNLVLTHCDPTNSFSTPTQIIETAKEFPDINFIIAHLGMPVDHFDRSYHYIFEGIEAVSRSRLDNVFLDTSHQFIVGFGCIEAAVEMVGAEKLLYGSDLPTMEPKMQITRIEVAEISEADRRKILYENARKLLHLK